MPRLKILSGYDTLKIFLNLGFEQVSQKGSHIIIRRIVEGNNQTLIIPNHKQLDTGTLRGILKQASKYIALDELKKYFYTE